MIPRTDRYLKVVLTVIALELGWMALSQSISTVNAQSGATPVIIRGIALSDETATLPVAVVGGYRRIPEPLTQRLERLQVGVAGVADVRASTPLRITTDQPLKIEADRPLRVEGVYAPTAQPRE